MKKAIKHDQNKAPFDLLPSKALEEVAMVFKHGAIKYSPNNWRKGFIWSRLIAASLRHVFSFNSGEDTDPETKLSHIAHATACLLMLLEHQKLNLGKDDRYKK